MTKSSTKSEEINGSLPNSSAVADLTQNQTAILITNEQPRAEIKTSGAALAGNIRDQKRKCCNWEWVFSSLMILLIVLYLLFNVFSRFFQILVDSVNQFVINHRN